MRASLKQAFALLPTLAAAAVLPPSIRRSQGRSQALDDVKPLVLELGMLLVLNSLLKTVSLMTARCSERPGNLFYPLPRLPWR